MVEAKSGSMWGGWFSNEVFGPYGVGMWINIGACGDFSRFLSLKVGDGSKIGFWQDV